MSTGSVIGDDPESLRARIRELEAQLDAKTRIATRAMATYQQRALQMEEHAAELRAANAEVLRVNERLSETLATLEQRDRVITNDLEQARRFQELILPDLPSSRHVEFAVFYRPAHLVGGDVYDIHELRPGVFRVFLADATGHGVQAALRTMLLKAEYDRVKLEGRTPEQVLRALNARLCADYPGLEMQCSASCIDLTLGAGGDMRVRYATAAHPPLLVLRGAELATYYQPAPFIGVVPEIELEAIDLEVARGERVVLYTDGLEDQWNAERREFGVDRVQALLSDRQLDLRAAVERLVENWTAVLAGQDADDDATLIAIESLG